jgi:hypothetical protein
VLPVVGGQESVSGEAVGDGARHPAAIEQLGIVAQVAQRAGQLDLAEALAHRRKLAARDEDAPPLGIVIARRALPDRLADDIADGKAVARIVHGGLEQAPERAGAELVEQHAPGARDARDGNRGRPVFEGQLR